MTSLSKFFVDKPLAANLVSILVIAIGLFSFLQLKRQATPLVDMQQMRIMSVLPAASPKDVELNVTTKIEEALEGVSGLKKYISHSSEGRSTIEVFIDPDARDKEKVKDDVRRAVESVQDLPDEMLDKPYIQEIKVDDMIVYELAIVFDQYSPQKIKEVGRQLKRKLLEIGEVARVRENAIPEREIKILLNNKKLNAKQVSVEEVLMAIKNNKIRLAGGTLESFTAEKGIITVSEFANPQDMGNIVIRSTSSGRHIYVKDVATILDDFEKAEKIVRFNGRRGGSLLIVKKASADLIELVDKVEVVKKEFLETAPEDLSLLTTWDFSVNTRTRLNIVSSNFAAGFFLVLIVLFMFLDPRIAMWAALGIPIAIAGATTILPLLDVSINSVSLCGMILVLGMIVDDAIIIAESIYRHMEDGLAPREAAKQGLQAVIKPVFGTIVTSIIAFVPLYFLPGSIGDFAVEVPTVVNIMLVASFLEATLILPSHLGHRKKAPSASHKPPGTRFILRMELVYGRFLGQTLRYKWLAFFATTIFLLGGITICLKMSRFRMFDLDQAYRIYLMGDVKEGSPLSYTESQVEVLEKIIDSFPGQGAITSVKTTVGQEGSFKGARFASHTSFLSEIVMKPFTERDITAQELSNWLKKAVETSSDLKLVKFDLEIDSEGPPVGRPIEIRIVGDDDRIRYELVAKLKELLQQYPVSEVISDNVPGKQELQLRPDFEALSQSGLTVSTVANTIRTIFDGSIVGDVQTPVESADYRLLMDERFHDFNDPLQDIYVRNQYGNLIPLKGLMLEERGRTMKKILHYNGNPSNLITANIAPTVTAGDIYKNLSQELSGLEQQFPGYSILLGGEAKESDKFVNQILMLLGLAIMGIYFWLAFQLESLSQPFMVVLAIPFGLIGMLAAFIGHGYDLSLLALVGVVGVGGVLVNDSLIMVEFINRLRREGHRNIQEAIILGAQHRFRPIVLTTLTTVTGLLPTAYGLIGGTDSFISPLVFAMTWGLMIGTPSVLIVIPVLYSIIISTSETIVQRLKID
ncbi:efflux RND transporter permease subunit [Pseudobacteriovorax antillogorgiicola]|uniref:Multidrug efflux pump subunit AcrB n=1 Tax=Pseudobacteriovorax antillogorgiicola TaxID=1513793 RepID=A0A1Y6CH38_9BACT|nr:efflux RND transporter permease subunit [Pseudobacteriovorax antillogorgiicola]TCS46996.1 multidrug efflux pump subunit AcrB [Pseudobacteriovorax antillogorgiicola]SMF64914.1 Multidrug efflux pump subunit AcrB [Pseudobacteriovorax antillogorgiicola]